MSNAKLSPQVGLALRYGNILPYDAFLGITGEPVGQEIWELLIRYTGELTTIQQTLNISFQIINRTFATTKIPKQQIETLSLCDNIAYIEFPEVMTYILDASLNKVCITDNVLNQGNYSLSGKGILIAVIDSGIDYAHEDFINSNNNSRIRFLWDQNIEGNPPVGFNEGTQYTQTQINEALRAPTKEQQLAIVPSQDTLGHGTAVAGIAGGNGKKSLGRYKGVATQSEFIIVKLKENERIINPSRGPRNIDVMTGLKYVEEKVRELKQPVSVIIGMGTNEGSHDGRSALEMYIDEVSSTNRMNITVGTGNQGNKDSHAQGRLLEGEEKIVQVFVDDDQPYYFATLWKDFPDNFSIRIQSPSGKETEELTDIINDRAFVFDNTLILVNFSQPSTTQRGQQIIIFLERFQAESINGGIWNFFLKGVNIIDGQYNIWGSSIDQVLRLTRFIEPDPFVTLTIPSTTSLITSVAAFNGNTNQILNFSGRGYTRDDRIKPDVTAPGSNIMAPSSGSPTGYLPVSGTSAAAAFVGGAYALLMEYGILRENDPFLYGERLKAYVIKNTTKLPQYAPYPNRQWGYGILCVDEVLRDLARRYNI